MRARELEQRIDELYALPLSEFTPQRNALAAELKKAGDREDAEAVRALAKPVLTAWVVNRLYRDERKMLDRLLDAGAELRTLQHQGAGDAEALRDAVAARRRAMAPLAERAEALVTEAGGSPTRATLRRIENNLEAIAGYGEAGPDQSLGRMSADLDPPGFEALLALAAAAPRRRTTAGKKKTAGKKTRRAPSRPTVDPRVVARARAAFDKARRELEKKRIDAERAEGVLRTADERLQETREMVRAAERGLRLTRDRARRSEQELQRETARAERAEAARAKAADALEAAEAALKKASKPKRR